MKQAYHSMQTASSVTQISSLVKPLLVALMACNSDATDLYSRVLTWKTSSRNVTPMENGDAGLVKRSS